MKRYFLVTVALFMAFPALAQNQELELHAGIETRVEIKKAQDIALQNNQKQISTRDYEALDPQQLENLQVRLKHIQCLPDRQVSVFSTGNYSIGYFGEFKSLYYRPDGSLYQIELRNKPVGLFYSNGVGAYPIKTMNYAYPSGELMMSRIATAYGHDFAFTPEGDLTRYCIDNTCFNPMGQVTGSRKDSFPCPPPASGSNTTPIKPPLN